MTGRVVSPLPGAAPKALLSGSGPGYIQSTFRIHAKFSVAHRVGTREDGRLLEPQLHDLIVGLNQIADGLRRARAAGSTGGDAPADHRAASLAYRGSKD